MTKPLTRVLTLTTTIAALGIAANLSVKPVEAATITIDDFTAFQALGGGSTFPTNPVLAPEANIIGGARFLNQVQAPISANIAGGNAFFNGGANATGIAQVTWSNGGTVPSGLGGRNLSSAIVGANPRFTTEVSNIALAAPGSTATLQVFEVGNATPATNTINLTTIASGDALEFNYADFAGPAINFGNVGAIRLVVTLVSPGPGLVPSFSLGTPIVAIPFNFQSTLGLLALGGLSGAYMLSKKSKKALQA
jgi:hypothetical protein